MKTYMTIALYRIEKGERVSETATIDNTVTGITVEGQNYKVTSENIWTGEETVYTVPTDKYEIVINRFF